MGIRLLILLLYVMMILWKGSRVVDLTTVRNDEDDGRIIRLKVGRSLEVVLV